MYLGLIGYFEDADPMKDAVAAMEAARLPHPTAYMPLPDEEILELLHPQTSNVRLGCILGAIIGAGIGWAMLYWMSFDYPLITGGKPIISWPPYAVIAFELTILFASLGTVAGLLVMARLPQQMPSQPYRPSFSVDRFALFLPGMEHGPERETFERILREAGAAEIHEVREREMGGWSR